MRISKRTQYGLRAMVCLALANKNKEKICSLKDISEKENISFDYLEKIVSQLEKKGFIESKRGAKGGYFLARSPKEIKIGEIVKTLEGTMALVRCVAVEKRERYNCPRKRLCKTLNVWQKIQDVLDSTLNSITLADLIKDK